MNNLNSSLYIDFSTLSVHSNTANNLNPIAIELPFHVAASNGHSILNLSNDIPDRLKEPSHSTDPSCQNIVSLLQHQLIALYEQTLVVELSVTGMVLSANLHYCQWLEMDCALVIGQPFGLLGHHVTVNGPDAAFRAAFRNGQSWKGVFQYQSSQGHKRWFELRLKPILGNDGQVEKFVLLGVDVSDYFSQLQEVDDRIATLKDSQKEMLAKVEDVKVLNQKLIEAKQELNGRVAALNNAAIVSETDLRGTITYANDLFCQISQYSMAELVGQNHRILKSGHQSDSIFKEMWQSISRGKHWSGILKNRAKDGSYYWVQTTITPILGWLNKPSKYVSVRFDITQQVTQHEQLSEAYQRLSLTEEELRQNIEEISAFNDELTRTQLELRGQISALNHAALVSETNVDGTITYVNQTFCALAKYKPEELLGQNHRILKSGHQPDALFVDLWRTISSGKSWQGQIKNRAADGGFYWVYSTITPVLDQDKKPYKYVSVRFNITQQVLQQELLHRQNQQLSLVEEELRQNIEELSTFFEQAYTAQLELKSRIFAVNQSALVSETDLEGNITFANETFCHLSRYSLAELIGYNHRILKSGQQPDALFVELWRTISSGKHWQGILKNKAKDGSYYWVQTTITPILDRDDKPVKYISIRFDISLIVEPGQHRAELSYGTIENWTADVQDEAS